MPQRRTIEVPERIGANGEVVIDLGEAESRRRLGTLKNSGADAVAICLFSLRAHLAVTKTGDRILFDFSGSDMQAQGAVNLVTPMVKNSCYCALMAMTDPNLPFNHGFVEVVELAFASAN